MSQRVPPRLSPFRPASLSLQSFSIKGRTSVQPKETEHFIIAVNVKTPLENVEAAAECVAERSPSSLGRGWRRKVKLWLGLWSPSREGREGASLGTGARGAGWGGPRLRGAARVKGSWGIYCDVNREVALRNQRSDFAEVGARGRATAIFTSLPSVLGRQVRDSCTWR